MLNKHLILNHFAPKGLVAELVEQSHWSCGGCEFNSHLSLEKFF